MAVRQRAELTLTEQGEESTELDFDIDEGARKPVAEIRAQRPGRSVGRLAGMVVVVRDAGPASRRWLVSSICALAPGRERHGERHAPKAIPEKAEPCAGDEHWHARRPPHQG